MSRAATKTDNSYFQTKVQLRLDNLPKAKTVRVLDCFCGDGLIWRDVERRAAGKQFEILSIDHKRQTKKLHLVGDNTKFLAAMDLADFDVIDLDAYRTPFQQLKAILHRPLKPGVVVFGTFIQSVMGCLPTFALEDLGYSRPMIRKVRTMFFRDGQAIFKGVEERPPGSFNDVGAGAHCAPAAGAVLSIDQYTRSGACALLTVKDTHLIV